jgi:hypothetical protein
MRIILLQTLVGHANMYRGGLNNGGAMTLMTLILQENMPKKFTRFASSDPQHYARLIRRKKKSLLVVKYPVYV